MDPIPFPFDANWDEPFVERIGYADDVHQSYAGREQRISLREVPQGAIEFTVLALDVRAIEACLLDALVWEHQAERWAIPLWPYAQVLGADVTPPHTTVACQTSGIPFAASSRITAPYVLLWRSPSLCELAVVQTIGGASLTLAAPTVATWPIGTVLVPVRLGRFGGEVAIPRPASAVRAPRLRWTLEDLPS